MTDGQLVAAFAKSVFGGLVAYHHRKNAQASTIAPAITCCQQSTMKTSPWNELLEIFDK